jgi:phytoene synthase
LLGIYALLAEWRAQMDPATESSVAQLKLAWWRDEMQRLNTGAPVHPISRYLAALPRADAADFAPLIAAVEAAAAHVAGAPIERSGELEAHSGALRAGPLLVAAELAGCATEAQGAIKTSVAALAAGEYLAAAIADYRREARAGRVAFPVDELLAAGVDDADLAAAEPPPHLQTYLEKARRRARQYFTAAAEAVPRPERARLRHVAVLATLGAQHLNWQETRGAPMIRPLDLYLAWTSARRAARQA